jgi:hypothetical protein
MTARNSPPALIVGVRIVVAAPSSETTNMAGRAVLSVNQPDKARVVCGSGPGRRLPGMAIYRRPPSAVSSAS